MKEFLSFLAKATVVALVIVLILWVGSSLLGRYVTNDCSVAVDSNSPVGERTVVQNESTSASSGTLILGEERICKFADGYDSLGRVVPAGTKVSGPALVKPDRDESHALLVMPGISYETTESDEVIWLLVGDQACVNSQAQFFVSSEVIK